MALRAFSLACSIPWAITPEALQQILEISTREHIPDFEAVEAKRARRLDATEGARIREGGVAVIPVTGPIFRYADFFTDFSGGATISSLSKDFNAALNDPSVSSIVLNIDSPGGEVAGVNEFAQMVFDARGRKPIVAYVDGLGASAAYWIASAAHEIVADATSMIGSIGVVAAIPNPDKKSAREVEFVSSQSPKKRPNPNTESGKDQIQALVDDLADVFVSTVARNRGVSVKTVLGEFGQGAMLVGQKSVEAGLADRLGSFEEVVADLAAGKKPRRYKPKMAAEAAEEEDMTLSERLKNLKARMVAAINADENPPEELVGKVEAIAGSLTVLQPVMGISKPEDDAKIAAVEAENARIKEENERLQKQFAAERQEKAKAEADAFVMQQLRTGKLMPAEADATKADYLQAVEDDAARPLGDGSRVSRLCARIESRPSHRLTEELTVGKTDKVLKADENNQTEMSEERRQQLLSATPAGKAALQVVK
jgi:signal peptide peptidase SppA